MTSAHFVVNGREPREFTDALTAEEKANLSARFEAADDALEEALERAAARRKIERGEIEELRKRKKAIRDAQRNGREKKVVICEWRVVNGERECFRTDTGEVVQREPQRLLGVDGKVLP